MWLKLTLIILVAVSLIAIALALVVFLTSRRRNRQDYMSIKLDQLYLRIKEDIKFAVAPKFMELSLGVNDLIDLAVEVWRIEQRIGKAASNIPETQLKALEHSAHKMRRYLEKCDIEIVDYKNTKYNDGLNLEILSIEKDPTIKESMVKETIEPTIMAKGQVVRTAKIILLRAD